MWGWVELELLKEEPDVGGKADAGSSNPGTNPNTEAPKKDGQTGKESSERGAAQRSPPRKKAEKEREGSFGRGDDFHSVSCGVRRREMGVVGGRGCKNNGKNKPQFRRYHTPHVI